MNWKLYAHENALKFAEESDEPEDENPGGSGGDDGESDQETDINKLRSSYDSQIAELNRKIAEFQKKAEEQSSTSVWSTEYNRAKQEIDGYLANLGQEKDPAKALEYARGVLQYIAPRYGSFAANSVQSDQMYKNAEAERYAFMLKAEVGGDVNSHKAQLLQAKTIDEMTLKFERMQLELAKERKPRRDSNSSNSPNPPRIDRGGGGASRTNVLREMEDIDLSTPEGQKKWQDSRSSFRRKIEATR